MQLLTACALFLSSAFSILQGVHAVPGNYFTVDILKNKRLPNPVKTETVSTQRQCKNFCIKHKTCDAFAISTFEKKCYLYKVTLGTPSVIVTGYVLYVRKKTQEEGYYVYGTNYIKLMFQRLSVYDAQKVCVKHSGILVAVRNEALNELLFEIMTEHKVWYATIGLTDEDVEGEWKCFDNGLATFTNWHDQGTWDRRDKNCAYISIDEGEWFHKSCFDRSYFFCQIPMF